VRPSLSLEAAFMHVVDEQKTIEDR
jgi:hypothetical protein